MKAGKMDLHKLNGLGALLKESITKEDMSINDLESLILVIWDLLARKTSLAQKQRANFRIFFCQQSQKLLALLPEHFYHCVNVDQTLLLRLCEFDQFLKLFQGYQRVCEVQISFEHSS